MGGKLIEVNVCSPGGFAEINENRKDKIHDIISMLKAWLNQNQVNGTS